MQNVVKYYSQIPKWRNVMKDSHEPSEQLLYLLNNHLTKMHAPIYKQIQASVNFHLKMFTLLRNKFSCGSHSTQFVSKLYNFSSIVWVSVFLKNWVETWKCIVALLENNFFLMFLLEWFLSYVFAADGRYYFSKEKLALQHLIYTCIPMWNCNSFIFCSHKMSYNLRKSEKNRI